MLDWEKVVQNKELLTQVEKIVNDVAEIYFNFPQEICEELNRLTGNDWTGEDYLEYCAGYWESPWNLAEVVFALFHDGEFPNKKEEDLYVWDIEHSIETDEDVISFYRFGEYEDEREKSSKYKDINVKQMYNELLDAFSKWDNNMESWEEDDYESFYCSYMETYGYEKIIDIYSGYERKFLSCTLTNLNEDEKDIFINIARKWCNHIVVGEER